MKPIAYFKVDMRHKILLTAMLAVTGLVAAADAVAQEECQVPLFVQQYGAEANVMLLADNSSSMNEAVIHLAYNRETVYPGLFDPELLYFTPSSRLYGLDDFGFDWPEPVLAYLVKSDNGEDGRYWGNYLNWIYFHATDGQRAEIPRVTRIQVLKLVLKDTVSRTPRVRMGITVFFNEGPGNIIGKCGKSAVALRAIIDGITANKWTPLGESMETMVDYFSDTGNDAPIQNYCQKNFLVVMTDGFPTMDQDVSGYLVDADGDGNDPGSCTSLGAPFDDSYQCSDHMDDVAYYLFNNDLRPDLPDTQKVITYTIGYGVDYGLLAETAMNGDGRYFHAENAVELVYAFRAIMQDIIMRLSSGSAVAVVSTERGDNDRMYRGKFMPGSWEGFLECYTLPFDDGEPPVWEAGHILADRSANSRSIFTALGSSVYNFVPGSAHNLWQAMETPDVETAADIITWIRGDFVAGYRNRAEWKLGDIVSSTPVIVGRPRSFSTDEAYQEYAALYADRLKTVYVGANDGMVHAFDAENGDELWAFVPQFALPKLSAIADSFYCHTYTCDQSISIADAKIGGVWRTVLATGGREGGSEYIAIDVSEPTAPTLMWQADLPNGKAFASEVEFARIGGVSVALIGSGLDEEFIESHLYAYNVETGQLIGSLLLSSSNQDRNKTTRPRGVDLDFDGETDLVYWADLLGNLWRADVGNDPDPSAWNLSTLFSCDQPITATPNPAFGEGNKILVYFGTGAFLKEEDFATTDQQSFYCVYDSHDGSTHTRSDLVDQTSSIDDIGTADGWYVDLWHHDGERVTEQAVIVAETVYFTAYAPLTDVCEAGGHSWLYTMAYDDGSAVITEEGEEVPRDVDLGDGVASRPVVDIVNETAVIQSSDATITVVDIVIDIFHLTVKSWQENYDFVQEPPQVQ